MRVPGIKSIAFISALDIDSSIELQAMSGISPDITHLQFTPFSFVGDPKLEISDSNENNGSNRKALLSFIVPFSFRERKCAFIVTASSGAIYLIGSADNVPAISTKDITAGPSTTNHVEVIVELSSPMAWIEVSGVIALGEEYPPVGWDVFREITEEEIDDIINNLPS